MKQGQVGIASLIVMFVGVIVVLAMFPAIADNQSTMTTKRSVTDEAVTFVVALDTSINDTHEYTVTNAPSGWKSTQCPLASIVISNGTGTGAQALTDTTDYVFTESAGTFTLVNNTNTILWLLDGDVGTDNSTYVDYQWCPDGYIPEGAGRSIAGLLMLFVALGVVGFTLYYALRGLVFK